MADLLLFPCQICGKFKRAKRPVCHVCWKKGYTINSPNCTKCGAITANRQRKLCDNCRAGNKIRAGIKYVGRNQMSGPAARDIMREAETPLKDDLYAQTHAPISDEEIALKREKFLALLEADVHVGDCGHPVRHHVADREEIGNWGTLANRHMTGGVAGQGSDRQHTFQAFVKSHYREDSRRR